MGINRIATMPYTVISILTWKDEIPISFAIKGNTGISMELPKVIMSGIEASANKSPFLLSINQAPTFLCTQHAVTCHCSIPYIEVTNAVVQYSVHNQLIKG